MTWHIPLSDLDYGPEEAAAVQRVLQNKWLSMGPETQAFEEEFASYIGTKHAIAVSNGTAALHLAYLALGLGPADAVIQPAVNFVAAANMTKAVGAMPVFADINSLDEPTLSPKSTSSLLSPLFSLPSALRPKAVVVMHYGGYCCRMSEIRALCQQHGLALIEDACHAVGARYYEGPQDYETTGPKDHKTTVLPDHRTTGPRITHHNSPPSDSSSSTLSSGLSTPAGSLGDIGCFSFFSNKNLVTGEGGMLTTNRDDIADKARNLRSHGMSSLTWDRHRGHAATYDVLAHGYNYRLDDLRSALGREQLKKLEHNNQRRCALTLLYWRNLEPLEARGWTIPFRRLSTLNSQLSTTSCHLLTVVAPNTETRWRRAEALKAAGIQSSLHYPYIPGFAAFRQSTPPPELPLARNFCQRVITLPLYPTMTEAQVETVCKVLISEF